MVLLKKLAFSPLFLGFLAATSYLSLPILKSPMDLLSFSTQNLMQLIILCSLVLLTSLAFVIFAVISQEWKIVLPVSLAGSLVPLMFVPIPSGYIFSGGFLLGTITAYILLLAKLKAYLTFDPVALFAPAVRNLSTIFILVVSLAFYQAADVEIKQHGFEIPDKLIDSTLNLIPLPDSNVKGVRYTAQLPTLTKEQLDQLKQNPGLLKQYGIKPEDLDAFSAAGNSTAKTGTTQTPQQELTKKLVKTQLDSLLKPYLEFVPAVLAILLFLTLGPILALLSFVIPAALWLVFWTLEKTGFIRFEKEMREVKKMVV